MTERLHVPWTCPAGRQRAGLWSAVVAVLCWKGLCQSLARAESCAGASSFPHLAARMGHSLSDMHVNWGSERGERAERSVVWSLLTWVFLIQLPDIFPCLKEVTSWLIFSYLLFLYTEALLSTNNWLWFISFSKINITQLIYKQHDAFQLRDGWPGEQAGSCKAPV